MLSMQSKTNKKQNMLHQGGKIEFCSWTGFHNYCIDSN